MKVTELGEFGLIDLLAQKIAASPGQQPPAPLIIGIGDDAAVWRADSSVCLATVDTMVEGVHFSPDTASWKEIGWRSLAINLSDIAAMGGAARYALIALGLPADTEVEDVSAMYDGMIELAGRSGTYLAGGNISRSPVVSITISVIGAGTDGAILRRSTAAPGDVIAVTGSLGSAAAGLEMLKTSRQFTPDAAAYMRNAFLRPAPHLEEGRLLVKHGVATAIDISDGLLADLRHVCQASGVSARVDTSRLPISDIVRENFRERALGLALAGGEDYELLFTAKGDIVERVRKEAGGPVTAIGEITAGTPGEIRLVDADGRPVDFSGAGWVHF